MKELGYHVEIIYLKLASPRLAVGLGDTLTRGCGDLFIQPDVRQRRIHLEGRDPGIHSRERAHDAHGQCRERPGRCAGHADLEFGQRHLLRQRR
jgi:hypothetical protein